MYYVPKTEKGKDTVKRIINASMELFSEKGFSSTSISDIAEKAGVAHGLFYFYFKSKYDILEELVKIINTDMRRYLKLNTIDINDRIEMEKVGFYKFFEWLNNNRRIYRILIEAQVHKPESYIWFYEILSKKYSEGLKRAMLEGQIVKVDPELLSYVLIGISHMLGLRYILWHNEGLSEKQLSDLNLLLEKMLKP